MSQPIENSLQNKLEEMLKQEVYLMRELLSNMHQEELSLMLHDQGSLHQLLNQRAFLIEKLSALRAGKFEIEHRNPYLSVPLELTSLNDQLNALTEKIQRQSSTNQRISAHPEHYAQQGAQLMQQTRPKKKVTVATLQIKK